MKKKKAVAYARFSSTNQREESIFRQVEKIEEFCRKNNLDLIEQYIDEAQTGTNDKRDDFQRMIEDAEHSDWDFVVVYKMDRLSRSVADAMHYKKRLNSLGIRILSVIEDFDESTPEGGFFNLITMGISEFYVKNLAREAFAGLMQNAKKAMHTGGVPPLGFDVTKEKKYIINEEEAIIVKTIFQMVLKDYSYADIARYLNSKGYLSKVGKPFKGNFTDILQNRKYIGEYVYNRSAKKNIDGTRNHHKSKLDKDIVRIPNALPRIVDDKTFEQVQNLLLHRKHEKYNRGPKSKYLLSELIRCKYCSSSIGGHIQYSGRNKSCRVIYRCKTKKAEYCPTKPINVEYMDRFVMENTKDILKAEFAPNLKEEINQKLEVLWKDFSAQNEILSHQIKEENSRLNHLIENIDSHNNSADKLINEQMQEHIDIIKGLHFKNHTIETDLRNMQMVFVKNIRKIQKFYQELLKRDRKYALSRLIDSIEQGNEAISVRFRLNSFLDFELNEPLLYTISIDRKQLAWNNF